MVTEQETLGLVVDLLAVSQDEVAQLSGFNKYVTFQAARESLPHFLALSFVGLEADALFQDLEGFVFGLVIYLSLVI